MITAIFGDKLDDEERASSDSSDLVLWSFFAGHWNDLELEDEELEREDWDEEERADDLTLSWSESLAFFDVFCEALVTWCSY